MEFTIKVINCNSTVYMTEGIGLSTKHDANLSWKFLAPKTRFPAGWFEIGNVLYNKILRQTYLSSPPLLVEIPKLNNKLKLPMYRERWATQWKIYRSPAHASTETKEEDKGPSWIIENRLTGGTLGSPGVLNNIPFEDASITPWILEFYWGGGGGGTAWRIKNQKTAAYLNAAYSVTLDCGSTAYRVQAIPSGCKTSPYDEDMKWWFRYVS